MNYKKGILIPLSMFWVFQEALRTTGQSSLTPCCHCFHMSVAGKGYHVKWGIGRNKTIAFCAVQKKLTLCVLVTLLLLNKNQQTIPLIATEFLSPLEWNSTDQWADLWAECWLERTVMEQHGNNPAIPNTTEKRDSTITHTFTSWTKFIAGAMPLTLVEWHLEIIGPHILFTAHPPHKALSERRLSCGTMHRCCLCQQPRRVLRTNN